MYRKVFASKVLDRKVVLISGGCAGIGRALAVRLAQAGARLVILDLQQQALPSLTASSGQIIVLSSLAGFAPLLYRSAYNASKHALHGLFETLRYELKDSGVNVMLVCPGFTATDLRKNALVGDGSVAPQPPLAMGKVASPQDVAEAIYRAALKRKRLLILSNVGWRARVLARFFPRLFERLLLPRPSGMKPQRTGRA